MQNVVLVGAVATIGALLLIAFLISRMIYICPPNEVLIFSGGHRKLPGVDRPVGYRLIQGGRGIRIPLIEVVDRMNLTNMVIELRVQGAYSRGGIPLNVQGVANVKVSSKTVQLANAIERFLSMTREQIMQVARETLEGNLRGVLSTLTPDDAQGKVQGGAQALGSLIQIAGPFVGASLYTRGGAWPFGVGAGLVLLAGGLLGLGRSAPGAPVRSAE